MVAVGIVAGNRPRLAAIRHLNREDLRQTTVQSLAIATASAAMLLWWHLLAGDAPDVYVFLYVPLVLAAAASCCALSRRSPRWAGLALSLTALAAIAMPYLGLGIEEAAYFFPLPVLIAAGAIHPAAGMACALAAVAIMRVGASPDLGRGAPAICPRSRMRPAATAYVTSSPPSCHNRR